MSPRVQIVLVWRLFNAAVIGPSVWGEPRDLAALERIKREEIPPLLDHLEGELPRMGFLFGP